MPPAESWGVEASLLSDHALQLLGAQYADGPVTTLGGGVTFFFTRHVGLDAGYRWADRLRSSP